MNALYVACAVVGVLLTVWVVVVLARAYTRNGTVAAAVKTVELLQAQVATLTAQNESQAQQITDLTNTMAVLREQVTNSAAVKDLATKQGERHEENLMFLSRLEGSLSRLESKIMRGA